MTRTTPTTRTDGASSPPADRRYPSPPPEPLAYPPDYDESAATSRASSTTAHATTPESSPRGTTARARPAPSSTPSDLARSGSPDRPGSATPPTAPTTGNLSAGQARTLARELLARDGVPVDRYGQPLRPYLEVVGSTWRVHFALEQATGAHVPIGPAFPVTRAGIRSALALCTAVEEAITHA